MATSKKDFDRFVESGTGINVITPAKPAKKTKAKPAKSSRAPKPTKAKRGK